MQSTTPILLLCPFNRSRKQREMEGAKDSKREGGRQGGGRKERGDTQREGGSKQGKERGEDKKMEGKRGETHTEGGKEREKRKGEDREMEGRTPYTVMSKHILKGNEWVTYLLFMRI